MNARIITNQIKPKYAMCQFYTVHYILCIITVPFTIISWSTYSITANLIILLIAMWSTIIAYFLLYKPLTLCNYITQTVYTK